MRKPDLRTAAAYHFLGLTTTDYLVDVAHAALENGIYAHGLGEIATLRHPTFADVGPFFDSAISELQIQVAGREQAIDVLTESWMVSLAEADSSPRGAVRQVYSDYIALFDRLETGRESFGALGQLIDFYYQYEYNQDGYFGLEQQRQTFETLDHECITIAKGWCRERWRPILDPSWLTATVVALAQGVHDEHAFDRLPILADALQDAGCENAGILNHCRENHPHVLGCWVVDLILGKE
jgi:hypothetical protein